MNESIETIDRTNLTGQTKIRLDKITEIENYFYQEINQSFINASFTLIFSLTTGIVKKLLSITRNKKKKHDKILLLAKSKLSSIETLRKRKAKRTRKHNNRSGR